MPFWEKEAFGSHRPGYKRVDEVEDEGDEEYRENRQELQVVPSVPVRGTPANEPLLEARVPDLKPVHFIVKKQERAGSKEMRR